MHILFVFIGNVTIYSTSTDSFSTTLGTSFGVFFVSSVCFFAFRLRPSLTWLYRPLGDGDMTALNLEDSYELLAAAGARPNMDAFMYLMFFKLMSKIVGVGCGLGVIIMVINANADPKQERNPPITDVLEQWTISNVVNPNWLWFHLIASYIFTASVFYFTNETYLQYIDHRHRFLKDSRNYSVFVSALNFPKSLFGIDNERGKSGFVDTKTDCREDLKEGFLEKFWKNSFPHDFRNSVIARDTDKQEELVSKLEGLVRNIRAHQRSMSISEGRADEKIEERVHSGQVYITLPGEAPSKPFYSGFVPLPVEFDHFPACECLGSCVKRKEMQDYVKEFNTTLKQLEALPPPSQVNAGFVEFNTLRGRDCAIALPHVAQPLEFIVEPAPEPRDIFWPNVKLTLRDRVRRSGVALLEFIVLMLFWIVPVALVATMSTITNLANFKIFGISLFGWLNPENPKAGMIFIQSLLEGLLSQLAMILFLMFLPVILEKIHTKEGLISRSAIEMAVCKSFVIFNIVFTFFLTALASSIFSIAECFANTGLADIINLIAVALPAQATLFAGYILLQGLSGFPLLILDPWRFITTSMKTTCFGISADDLTKLREPLPFNYGAEYPMHILVAILAMVYSTIAPIVLYCALIYFVLGYICVKYQILFMRRNKYDSGGQLWPVVFNRIITGLIIAQITLVGVFSLKLAPFQAALSVPLPLVSLLFMDVVNKAYYKTSLFLPTSLQDERLGESAFAEYDNKTVIYSKLDKLKTDMHTFAGI